MADWNMIVDVLKASDYNVGVEQEGLIGILAPVAGGRSQEVYITHASAGEHELAVINSAFAVPNATTNYEEILEAATQIPFGAVAIFNGALCLRHAVLLDDLEPDAFALPLRAVMVYADQFEQRFFGGDRF